MIWKIHPYKIKEMLINKKLAKFDYKILTELDWKVRPVVISRMCQSSAPEAEIQKAFLYLSKVVFFSSKHQFVLSRHGSVWDIFSRCGK